MSSIISKPLGGLLIAVAMLSACGRLMEHSHCDDTMVNKRVSPDGKHLSTLFHRTCSSGTKFTYVKLEETATFPWLWSGDYEYVVSFVGEYPIDAQWKDNAHLEVESPGLRQQEQAYVKAEPPKTLWKGIKISYK